MSSLQHPNAPSSISDLIQERQAQRSSALGSIDKESDSGSMREFASRKAKQNRDPHSHRVIEKRRRDRMNQSLSDLSHLIPAGYLKQGQSRVEKAEIVELATQHIVALSAQIRKCEAALGADFPGSESACCVGKFYQGFREASKSAVAFLTEQESFSSNDPLCIKLRSHLHSLSQQLLPRDLPAPQKVEHFGPAASSPAGSATCSTDEAHSEAFLDAEKSDMQAVNGNGGAASSRRDPKSNFRARFEAEATIPAAQKPHQDHQQLAAGQKRKAEIECHDGEPSQLRASLSQSEPAETGLSRSPGLDYRERIGLLDRRAEPDADEASSDESDDPFLPGFVLHKSGTYYEPVVIPPSCLGSERVCQPPADGRRPLHPVSIPVNFRVTKFVVVRSGSRRS